MKSNVQTFIALLFLSRDAAHKAHLNASTYSEHVALGAFYDGIIDLADTFAEAWMGRNEEKLGDFPSLPMHKEDIRDFVPKEDTTLNNIIDEIVALYLSTNYKLKFLK